MIVTLARKIPFRDRKNLKDSDFAIVTKLPNGKKKRQYIIKDIAHAVNALGRAKQQAEQQEKPDILTRVRKAVFKRFPSLKKGSKTKATVGNIFDNLTMLNNTLEMLSEQHYITSAINKDDIILVVDRFTRMKMPGAALMQPQPVFSKVLAKISHNIVKAEYKPAAHPHLSPAKQQHVLEQDQHLRHQTRYHDMEAVKHLKAANEAQTAGKHNDATEHRDMADYHNNLARHHMETWGNKVRPHLQPLD
jgi:hypothetical protein